MSKIFRQFWKSYNDYSKGDRNAIIILCVLILVSVTTNLIIRGIQPKSKYNYSEYEQLLNDWEGQKSNSNKTGKTLFVFDPNTIIPEMLDSLDIPEYVKRNILSYRKAGGRFSESSQIRKIYGMNDSIFTAIENYIRISEKSGTAKSNLSSMEKPVGFFDPNTAEFNQLIQFGFNQFQANNLIDYRKKAGVIKAPTDLLKIYGVDTVFFKSIENYIQIEITEESSFVNYNTVLLHVELNSADSIELVQLNGVGSVFANRILKYRDLLGGFYSATQLLEVYNFPVETFKMIENNISADTLLIKKIRLNFAEYNDLIRHPYFNKKQVEAVLNYREKNGAFQNIIQVKSSGLVDSETFSKISFYLTCR